MQLMYPVHSVSLIYVWNAAVVCIEKDYDSSISRYHCPKLIVFLAKT